jgi:hypothetical protein
MTLFKRQSIHLLQVLTMHWMLAVVAMLAVSADVTSSYTMPTTTKTPNVDKPGSDD